MLETTILTLWLLGGQTSEEVSTEECHALAYWAVQTLHEKGAHMSRNDNRVVLGMACGPYRITLPLPPSQAPCEVPAS